MLSNGAGHSVFVVPITRPTMACLFNLGGPVLYCMSLRKPAISRRLWPRIDSGSAGNSLPRRDMRCPLLPRAPCPRTPEVANHRWAGWVDFISGFVPRLGLFLAPWPASPGLLLQRPVSLELSARLVENKPGIDPSGLGLPGVSDLDFVILRRLQFSEKDS